MGLFTPNQKVKIFRSHFWQSRNSVNRQIEKYAAKHGYRIVGVQYMGYGTSRAQAVFTKI